MNGYKITNSDTVTISRIHPSPIRKQKGMISRDERSKMIVQGNNTFLEYIEGTKLTYLLTNSILVVRIATSKRILTINTEHGDTPNKRKM